LKLNCPIKLYPIQTPTEEHRKKEEQQKTKDPEEIYLLIQNSINNPFLHIFKYHTYTQPYCNKFKKGFKKINYYNR